MTTLENVRVGEIKSRAAMEIRHEISNIAGLINTAIRFSKDLTLKNEAETLLQMGLGRLNALLALLDKIPADNANFSRGFKTQIKKLIAGDKRDSK